MCEWRNHLSGLLFTHKDAVALTYTHSRTQTQLTHTHSIPMGPVIHASESQPSGVRFFMPEDGPLLSFPPELRGAPDQQMVDKPRLPRRLRRASNEAGACVCVCGRCGCQNQCCDVVILGVCPGKRSHTFLAIGGPLWIKTCFLP